MRGSQERRRTGRMLAWSGAAVLVAGSIGFTAPVFAAQPDQPGHSAAAQEHGAADQADTGHGQTAKQADGHQHKAAPAGGHSGSAVNLPGPNDFQAQADPDGMENGGVDQPGGAGGVDTTTQDGNNGSGNDTDCEDDNNGLGVPGHCKDRPAPAVPPAVDLPDETDVPDGSIPNLGGNIPAAFGQALGSVSAVPYLEMTAPQVSAPGLASQVAPARAGSVATVLPNTGAGQALLGLAIAALAALAMGAGLVRRGRRTAHVTG